MATKILPCPFCGGEAAFEQTGKNELTLRCVGKQPSGLLGCGPKYVQKAGVRFTLEWLEGRMAENWNRRSPALEAVKHADFAALEAAYIRGANWWSENQDFGELLMKAAHDYADKQQQPEPMKLDISREWFEKRAAAEGDLEIGAGSSKTMTLNLTDEEIAELEKLVNPEAARLREALEANQQVIETLRAALEAFVKAESDIEVSAAIEYDQQLEAAYQLALAALSDTQPERGQSNAEV